MEHWSHSWGVWELSFQKAAINVKHQDDSMIAGRSSYQYSTIVEKK